MHYYAPTLYRRDGRGKLVPGDFMYINIFWAKLLHSALVWNIVRVNYIAVLPWS
jgi:hypothetical protein